MAPFLGHTPGQGFPVGALCAEGVHGIRQGPARLPRSGQLVQGLRDQPHLHPPQARLGPGPQYNSGLKTIAPTNSFKCQSNRVARRPVWYITPIEYQIKYVTVYSKYLFGYLSIRMNGKRLKLMTNNLGWIIQDTFFNV